MSRLVLVALVLAAPAGLAQIVPVAEHGPPAPPAPVGVGSLFTPDAVGQATGDVAPPARPSAMLGMALRAAAQPTVATLAEVGAVVTLPPGWSGRQVASIEGLPRYAVFTLQNDAPGHRLAGAVVRVERVTGVEDIHRERWMRGQTPYRYHVAGPVGPIEVPGHGTGVEVAGSGVRGAVVFVRHHTALWAIGVEAPEALWARERDALLALVRGVRLL